jgi:hypothetical protein
MEKLTIIKLYRVFSIAMLNYQRVRSYKQNPFISHFKCGNGVPPHPIGTPPAPPDFSSGGPRPARSPGGSWLQGYSHRCRKCLKARKYGGIWRPYHRTTILLCTFWALGVAISDFTPSGFILLLPRIVSRTIAYLPRLTIRGMIHQVPMKSLA